MWQFFQLFFGKNEYERPGQGEHLFHPIFVSVANAWYKAAGVRFYHFFLIRCPARMIRKMAKEIKLFTQARGIGASIAVILNAEKMSPGKIPPTANEVWIELLPTVEGIYWSGNFPGC